MVRNFDRLLELPREDQDQLLEQMEPRAKTRVSLSEILNGAIERENSGTGGTVSGMLGKTTLPPL